MKKLTVYLSGRMNGLSKEQYTELFDSAERELLATRSDIDSVINPVNLGIYLEMEAAEFGWSPKYSDYLLNDIEQLRYCDEIHMLNNWNNSKGAIAELAFAKAIGLTITYQQEKQDNSK